MPSLRKAGHPEPTLLLLGSFVLTCGRATLAFATTVPHLMLGELLVVTGAATCFTLVRPPPPTSPRLPHPHTLWFGCDTCGFADALVVQTSSLLSQFVPPADVGATMGEHDRSCR